MTYLDYEKAQMHLTNLYLTILLPLFDRFFSFFYVKSRSETVKFTSFDSYCTYNIFRLIFKRNLQVFIEKNALGMNSRKNRGLIKPRGPKEAE